ncbi:hypothetical protein V8F06_012698 [Rhypophila decipiens]
MNQNSSAAQAPSSSSISQVSPVCGRIGDAVKDATSAKLPSETMIRSHLCSITTKGPEQIQTTKYPLPEPPDGSVVVPIEAHDKVYPFRGAPGLYVAHENQIPPPARQLQQWETQIKNRLLTDIFELQTKMIRTKIGRRFPPTISPELRMSGTLKSPGSTHVELSPRIWILYDDNRWKKEIKKFVGDLWWLFEYCDPTHIEIRKGGPRLATLDPPLFVEGLPLPPGHGFPLRDGIDIYLHAERPVGPSAIGLMCCATVTKHGKICGQRISRLGGLVSIDHHRTLSMTTAHGMIELIWQTALDDDVDEEDGEDDELFSGDGYASDDSFSGDGYGSKNSNVGTWPKQTSFDPNKVEEWDLIETLGTTSFLGGAALKLGFYLENLGTLETIPGWLPRDTDFSLWGLQRANEYKNIYQTPGNPHEMVQLLSDEEARNSVNSALNDVFILLGPNNILKADPLPNESEFMVRGVRFVARKIRTQEPIGPGCSGSWVVKGNEFLGMLIACNEYEPYAYYTPRGKLFADVRSAIIGSKNIELYPGPPAQHPASARQTLTQAVEAERQNQRQNAANSKTYQQITPKSSKKSHPPITSTGFRIKNSGYSPYPLEINDSDLYDQPTPISNVAYAQGGQYSSSAGLNDEEDWDFCDPVGAHEASA